MDRSGVSWGSILVALSFLLGMNAIHRCCGGDEGHPMDTVAVVADTVVVTRVDTIYVDRPRYVERRVVDTVYMRVEDRNLPLPVERLRYNKDGVYDIWVSGVRASLDSVRVYVPATERTVNRTVTVSRDGGSFACVPYMGFKAFNGSVSPSIGFMLETPKSWVLGAEMGYSKASKTYWGMNVGYRFGR